MSMRRCPGKGGLGTLFVNGEKVRQGRIEATQCCGFSATEGADVGMNTGTPVSTDYRKSVPLQRQDRGNRADRPQGRQGQSRREGGDRAAAEQFGSEARDFEPRAG